MRALLAAVVAALILAVSASVANAQPVAEGMRFESEITYRLEPDAERVAVSMEITVTNEKPDEGNAYYYFDRIVVPLLSEAVNVSARQVGGGSLRVGVDDDGSGLSVATVWLPAQLRYGQTQRIELSYILPGLPPRSDGGTRATEGYASFEAFAFGDPRLTSVTLMIPDTYDEISLGDVRLTSAHVDGHVVYTDKAITDPWTWGVRVAARNDALLEERVVDVGESQATLRFWPGDEEWADFAEDVIVAGVPLLEDLVGLPWPAGRELQIIESVVPRSYGYGGWYDGREHAIHVGDELDTQLMLHELSHVWFNYGLADELWFVEGLAELYSHRALDEIEGSAPQPRQLPDDSEGAQPLVSWSQSPADRAENDPYGYRMSWWVLDQLVDEIGTDTMAEVLMAAAEGDIAYRGPDGAEQMPGSIDWRRLLDLLEEVGGSDEAASLYEDHVLTDRDTERLADRATARTAYADLVAAGGDWKAPLPLRRAMAQWRFAGVGELVRFSGEVLDARDTVLESTGRFGVDDLPALRETYHTTLDIEELVAEAEEYMVLAETLSAAADSNGGLSGLLSELALVGAGVEERLARSAQMLADGELAAADRLAQEVRAEVDSSTLIGAVLVIQLTLAGMFAVVAVRRRRAGTA